mgnify:CR=1 FL=1
MTTIRLYIDEDAMDRELIRALRARNVDVISVQDTGTEGQLDEEQLNLATSQNRVLYSHNIADFCQLHTEFIAEGKTHAGIVLLSQEYSIGEQLRAILGLVATKTAEEIQNQLEFLSKYLRNN